MEHRKLAVDLVDVIIKWELQRIKEDAEAPPDTCEVSWPRPLLDRCCVQVLLFLRRPLHFLVLFDQIAMSKTLMFLLLFVGFIRKVT